MKTAIHPKWYSEAKVTCACGNVFTIGATYPELSVDICQACHPFYTGQMKFIDTAGRVDAFREKLAKAKTGSISKNERRQVKKAKRIEAELDRPMSLQELRSKSKASKN